MTVDGETLLGYSIRVGLATATMLRSTRMDKLDELIDRKSEYPKDALILLEEVTERRRLIEARKAAELEKEKNENNQVDTKS